MDREQLADFLRRRREALQPEDVGLVRGPRRRTSGLRREEVALLASMSTDYYGRLEQQRGPQPSESMLAAIAQALRLSQVERDHLFRLAGHTAPARTWRSDHVSPALLRVLDRLDTPAQVVNDLTETLVQNAHAVALTGGRRTTPAMSARSSTASSPTRRRAPTTRPRTMTSGRADSSPASAPPSRAIRASRARRPCSRRCTRPATTSAGCGKRTRWPAARAAASACCIPRSG